jgi:hypothetical protein
MPLGNANTRAACETLCSWQCLLTTVLFASQPQFCKHGDVTATTGECMCHWQHKDGCKGAGCEYQMGLSFYHYSCKDCECVPEPR